MHTVYVNFLLAKEFINLCNYACDPGTTARQLIQARNITFFYITIQQFKLVTPGS